MKDKQRLRASRCVKDALSKISVECVAKIKRNPKAISKWLQKMASSVSKKVAVASKVLFMSEEYDINSWKARADGLRNRLEEKRTALKQAVLEEFTRNVETSYQRPQAAFETAEMKGIFAAKVEMIGEKLRAIAHNLSASSSELQERVTSLQSTVAVIDAELKKMPGITSDTSSAAGRMTRSRAKGGDPNLQALRGHLDTV